MVPSASQVLKLSLRTHRNLWADKDITLPDVHPGTYWQQMTVSLNSDKPFQLMFQATPGVAGNAIAIDDVTFSSNCV